MEAVAFLNGIMMTADSWIFQRRALASHYRLVLHDFRGQLRNLVPGPFTLQQHIDDLRELLDAEGVDRVHLVGTSYGGEVGMLFALAHPQRVRSLAVIACVSHVGRPLREAVERWRDVARAQPEQLFDLTAPYNFSPGMLTPTFLEAGRERLRNLPPQFFASLADLCDAFLTLDLTARLHEIRVPTLVIAAEKDALKPLHYSREIASSIPNARLEVIPDAAHAVVVEDPHSVNALLLDWLSSSPS